MVDGRYEVKLPWKEGAASDLMDNREAAEARLSGLVRKLDKEPDLRERLMWPLGVVTRLHPGSDGVVRAVDLRTAKGVRTRAVQRLHDLEV
ncbi:hypothetical protein FJT64_003435 [Amphibalanus amphitrite]|uniref:DUF5641 domain-containing protein n=1 Tax=Amphibalanus amphitrite TaxID=1232801 RepID=A0A6A4VZY3_AMPAM|nr:hypothetical protein FJT64_003435 [Amphibalanus amphitrite]